MFIHRVLKPESIRNKRILLSPLNWGMGHVSRCIGLIDQLLKQDNEVFVACSASQQSVFEEYFDDLVYISHDPYPFKFGGKGHFALDLLRRAFQLSRRRKRELDEVKQLVNDFNIDIVIADHRYGFRCLNAYSIFVTHQVTLPVLWYEAPVQWLHRHLLKKFDRIWIMDYQDNRLAGKLSRNTPLHPADYIGPYSRFQLYNLNRDHDEDVVLIASGPEVYAQQLIGEVLKRNKNIVIIASDQINVNGNRAITGWRNQDQFILKTRKIISRSGYSTIMDLCFLQTASELISTPGQREQEYLMLLHKKAP